MRKISRHGLIRRPAAAAIELMLTLPVLLTLALACADLARYVHMSLALSNAVRAGAEWGAGRRVTSFTQPDWEGQIVAIAREEMLGVPGAEVGRLEVTVSFADEGNKLQRTEVEGTYPFETIIKWPSFPPLIEMRRQHAAYEVR